MNIQFILLMILKYLLTILFQDVFIYIMSNKYLFDLKQEKGNHNSSSTFRQPLTNHYKQHQTGNYRSIQSPKTNNIRNNIEEVCKYYEPQHHINATSQVQILNSEFYCLRKKIDEVEQRNTLALSKIHKVFSRKKRNLQSESSSNQQQQFQQVLYNKRNNKNQQIVNSTRISKDNLRQSNKIVPITYTSHNSRSKIDKHSQFMSHSHRQILQSVKHESNLKPKTPQHLKTVYNSKNQVHCIYNQKIHELNKSLKMQYQKSQMLNDQLNQKNYQNNQVRLQLKDNRELIKQCLESFEKFYSTNIFQKMKMIDKYVKKCDTKLKSLHLIVKDAEQHKKSRIIIKQTEKQRERSNSKRSSSKKTKKQLISQPEQNANNKTIIVSNLQSYKIKNADIDNKKKTDYQKFASQSNINFKKIVQNYQKIIDQKNFQIKSLQQKCKSILESKNKLLAELGKQQKIEQGLLQKLKITQISRLSNDNKKQQSIVSKEVFQLKSIVLQKDKQILKILKDLTQSRESCQNRKYQLEQLSNQIANFRLENDYLKEHIKTFGIQTKNLEQQKLRIVKINISLQIQLQNINRKYNCSMKQLQIKDNKIQQLERMINYSSKTNQFIKNDSILDESVSHQKSFIDNNFAFAEQMKNLKYQMCQLQQKYQQRQQQMVLSKKALTKIQSQNQLLQCQVNSLKLIQIQSNKFIKEKNAKKAKESVSNVQKNQNLTYTFKKLSNNQKNEMFSFGDGQIESQQGVHQKIIDFQSLDSLRQTNLLLSINSLKNKEDSEHQKLQEDNRADQQSQSSSSNIQINQLYSQQQIIQEKTIQQEDPLQNMKHWFQDRQKYEIDNQLQSKLRFIQNEKLELQTNLIKMNANLTFLKQQIQNYEENSRKIKQSQAQGKKALKILQIQYQTLLDDKTNLIQQNKQLKDIIQQAEKANININASNKTNVKSESILNLSMSQFSIANVNKQRNLLNSVNQKQSQNLFILKQRQQQIIQLQGLLKLTQQMQQKSLLQYKKSLNNTSSQISKKQKKINHLIGELQALKGQNHKLRQKIIIIQNTFSERSQQTNQQKQQMTLKKIEQIIQQKQNLLNQKITACNLINQCYAKIHQQQNIIMQLKNILKQENYHNNITEAERLQTSVVYHKINMGNISKDNQKMFVRSRKGSIYQQYDNLLNNNDEILLNESYQQDQREKLQKSREKNYIEQQNHTASRMSNFSHSYQHNISFLFQKQHQEELKQKLAKIKLQRKDHIRLFDSTAKYIHHLKKQIQSKNKKINKLQKQVKIMRKSQLYVITKSQDARNQKKQPNQVCPHQQIQIPESGYEIDLFERDCQSQNGHNRSCNKFISYKKQQEKYKKIQNQLKLLIEQNRILENQFQILQQQLLKAQEQQNSLINIKNIYKNQLQNQQKRYIRQIKQLSEQIQKLRKMGKSQIQVFKQENYLSKEEVQKILSKIVNKYENVRKILQPLIDFSDYQEDLISDQNIEAQKLLSNLNFQYLQNFEEELRLCRNLIESPSTQEKSNLP